MNLNQLRGFYNVAKCKSFSLAAEALFLTQPSISAQIKMLEDYYNIKLFERFGNTIELTSFGKELFPYAEKIFGLEKEAEETIENIKKTKHGTINISAISSITCHYWYQYIMATFQKKYPGIIINLKVEYNENVVKSILSFKNDLGFIGQLINDKDIIIKPLWKEEIVILASPSHKLAKLKRINFDQLYGEPFIMPETNSGTRTVIEEIFKNYGISPKVVMELGENESIKWAVKEGIGISMLSKNIVKQEIETGLLKAI